MYKRAMFRKANGYQIFYLSVVVHNKLSLFFIFNSSSFRQLESFRIILNQVESDLSSSVGRKGRNFCQLLDEKKYIEINVAFDKGPVCDSVLK